MTKLFLIVPLAVGLCVAESAFAASLEAVQGEVSINRGEGFQRVTGPTEARAGDLLLASQGGSAKLVYADGCPVRIIAGTVVRVAVRSPCKAQYYAGLEPAPGPVNGWPRWGWMPWAMAAGVAITACVAAFCDDDNNRQKPASK